MNVRSATGDDFEAIREVARETWHDTYDELDAETIERTVENWYTDDSMPLEAPGTIVLVAERAEPRSAEERAEPRSAEERAEPRSASSRTESGDGGEIVGFTHAVAQGERADILRLYVHPNHQGEGIGTELHERLLAEIDGHDVDRVRSLDFAFNDVSRQFYAGLGFERTGEGEVEIDGERYPEAVYTLEL